jgi:hypothetical protein
LLAFLYGISVTQAKTASLNRCSDGKQIRFEATVLPIKPNLRALLGDTELWTQVIVRVPFIVPPRGQPGIRQPTLKPEDDLNTTT